MQFIDHLTIFNVIPTAKTTEEKEKLEKVLDVMKKKHYESGVRVLINGKELTENDRERIF